MTLADGTKRAGNLIVAADGIHSLAVKYVVGYENPAQKTGFVIFRFLIPTEVIRQDDETKDLMKGGDGATGGDGISLILEDKEDRRLIWYPCRG